MFNSPYAKGGMQTNGPAKPEYAGGGGLNQNPGGTQQGGDWNQWGFNGFMGAGSNAPYSGPVGGGFQQQVGPPAAGSSMTMNGQNWSGANGTLNQGAPNPGQPGQATNAPSASIPAGPTMPQFTMGSANNPAVNLNGADNPRRFMQRPSMSPQQMRQLTRPGAAPTGGYKPPDGTIDLPPGPVGY